LSSESVICYGIMRTGDQSQGCDDNENCFPNVTLYGTHRFIDDLKLL